MKLLLVASLAFCNAEMGRQRRWRMERRKKAAAKAATERREREKNAPRDAESTSDGTIANWRQRARAWGLNPPDEDNKTAANATTTPGAGAKDNYLRTYNVRPSAPRLGAAAGRRRQDGQDAPDGHPLVRLHRAQGPGDGRDHVPLAQGPRQGPVRGVVGRADGGVMSNGVLCFF